MIRTRAPRLARVGRQALWIGALAAAVGAAADCEDGSPALPCVNAPPGGCPADDGADVCADPSCDAVYACQDGRWVFDRACSAPRPDGGVESGALQRDATPGPDAAGSPDATAPSADAAVDAAIDAPPGAFGGPGCVALQPPDCSLGVALSCGAGAACCGCDQFFVCADGGWNVWGDCVDGAVVAH
jgi:hypothetical protein